MAAGPHRVEADGYCNTCQMLPCRERTTGGATSPMRDQLTRIERKLNQIMRAAGLEVPGDDPD